VSLHTSQSGLIGFANHGSAHPCLMHARMVSMLICWPCSSNNGSLPPGCFKLRRKYRRCAVVGRKIAMRKLSPGRLPERAQRIDSSRPPRSANEARNVFNNVVALGSMWGMAAFL